MRIIILFMLLLVATAAGETCKSCPPLDTDKSLFDFLDVTAEDLRDCPGILDRSPVQGVTFRDIVKSQQAASEELQKARVDLQSVDTVEIWNDLIGIFWREMVPIPYEKIAEGLIMGYGSRALIELVGITSAFGVVQVANMEMQFAQLFSDVLKADEDRKFLANQNAVYLRGVSEESPNDECQYDSTDFTMSCAVDDSLHNAVWDFYSFAGVCWDQQQYLKTEGIQCPGRRQKFNTDLVKYLTKEAWRLAYANYLLGQDRRELRDQILSACEKPPETPTPKAGAPADQSTVTQTESRPITENWVLLGLVKWRDGNLLSKFPNGSIDLLVYVSVGDRLWAVAVLFDTSNCKEAQELKERYPGVYSRDICDELWPDRVLYPPALAVFHSSDRGNTWEEQYRWVPPTGTARLSSSDVTIEFDDEREGWVIVSGTQKLHTADGGKTWQLSP
jgi:hypothetical protein